MHPGRKNFVCQLVDRLRAGSTFDVPEDQLITPTYAPSLARAVVDLTKVMSKGTFHVAGPRVLGRMEFARLAANAFGLPDNLLRPRETRELPLVARRPLAAGLEVGKLREALGYDLLDAVEGLSAMAAFDPESAL
jgi:dTDP-4-dehydrorhamnose reductase